MLRFPSRTKSRETLEASSWRLLPEKKIENIDQMKKKIYVFSGLGTDKQVFQKIKFGGYDPIFIN